eukprot:166600-Rhodomonas_salina.1
MALISGEKTAASNGRGRKKGGTGCARKEKGGRRPGEEARGPAMAGSRIAYVSSGAGVAEV